MFGTRLKEIRKGLGFTQESIVTAINNELDKISDKNISIGTYRNWEQNVAIPNSTYLTVLAPLLKTSTDFLLGIGGTGQASDNDSPTIERTVQTMRRLNNDGQGKVADYADDLDKSGQYRCTDAEDALAEPVDVYSVAKAAAGDGEHYDAYQDAVYHRVRSEDIPPHDDAIDVIGTSMEPTIHDGDVAFVLHDFDRRDGAIYAVSLDDEIVIKRVYFERHSITLVSDNEEYKDRVIHESDFSSVHLSGRVVGWATPEE